MKSAVLALIVSALFGAELPKPVAKIDPAATVHIDSETLLDYDGYALRISWQRGFLIAGSRADFPTRHDQVTVFDSDGKLLRKLNVLLPESKWANLVSAAILDSKGTIAVAVNAHTADFPEPAAVIAVFDPKGKLTRTFRTEPFYSQAFCADANGDLWAFNASRFSGPSEPQWSMLRHISQDGRELAAFMPRGEFIARKLGTHSYDQLFCGKDRLSVFFQNEETYVEIGYDGTLLDKFQMPSILPAVPSIPHNLTNLQLTEGGIVLTWWASNPYYLDRTNKVWKPITWEHDKQYNGMIGKQADGSVVILSKGTHDNQFDWLKIPLDLPDAYATPNTLAGAR